MKYPIPALNLIYIQLLINYVLSSPSPHSWWRHQMGTFSALLDICAGNSTVTGEFPAQRQVMRSFDVFFDLRLDKCLSKQSRGWWFGTPLRTSWRHCNVYGRHHLLLQHWDRNKMVGIFFTKNDYILIRISLKFAPTDAIDGKSILFQIIRN